MNEQTTSECLLTFEPGVHAARRREALALLKQAVDRLSSAAAALEGAAEVALLPATRGSATGRALSGSSRRLALHFSLTANGIATKLALALDEETAQ